jgi:hypothetical protein
MNTRVVSFIDSQTCRVITKGQYLRTLGVTAETNGLQSDDVPNHATGRVIGCRVSALDPRMACVIIGLLPLIDGRCTRTRCIMTSSQQRPIAGGKGLLEAAC